MIIWRDGQWIENPPYADDRGAHLGDGLFETILWRDGKAVRLERHLERLANSAQALGLACPSLARVHETMAELARTNHLSGERAAINLSLRARGSRGLNRTSDDASLMLRIAPAPADTTTLTLAAVSIRRNETAPSTRHKTLSYIDQIEARREAHARGADEAAQLGARGAWACAAAGNLIFVIDGEALTPRIDDGALPGTVRAELLARGLIAAARIDQERLRVTDSMAVTNALVGVRSVSRLDEQHFDVAHPLLAALKAAIES